MTDEQIIKILRRDGYHCAADRIQELLDEINHTSGFFKILEETSQKAQRYYETLVSVPK